MTSLIQILAYFFVVFPFYHCVINPDFISILCFIYVLMTSLTIFFIGFLSPTVPWTRMTAPTIYITSWVCFVFQVPIAQHISQLVLFQHVRTNIIRFINFQQTLNPISDVSKFPDSSCLEIYLLQSSLVGRSPSFAHDGLVTGAPDYEWRIQLLPRILRSWGLKTMVAVRLLD